MVTRRVLKPVLPALTGREQGLAFSLWLPARPRGGIVVLHGADSQKESHHDFCRAALPLGLAALAFDARGHGDSEGALDGRAIEDVATMVALLRTHLPAGAPVALRGSSMGGYLALTAAAATGATAVVAIAPASGEGLRHGLRSGRVFFAADTAALDGLLARHDLGTAVGELPVPVLIMHAEGDEVVPVQHSRELARAFGNPASRLIALPGGHHRSVQHDSELQAVSLRFLNDAMAPGS